MGRLSRVALALVLALSSGVVGVAPAASIERFGAMEADVTFGLEIVFRVDLDGDAPERLELLLRFGDETDSAFVAPVEPMNGEAEWRWDAARNHLTPNTAIRYQWRARDGETTLLSPERTIVYADNRPGLEWQTERFGEATVHWYGNAASQARRFGELTAGAARSGEELLGHELAGPVDIFVYSTRDDFFAALGPGAREWTGAAAFPALRSVFMHVGPGAGGQDYQETALVHEVTHVVFHDATDNLFRAPPKWLNEGIAVWSEGSGVAAERSLIEFEARGAGLLAFDAIAEQFPVDERRARLAYAQGAAFVDIIIRDHGPEAIARIAAAYRDGATDGEALRAGTGLPASELEAAFFAEFGSSMPAAVEPESLLPSNVALPPTAPDPVDTPRSPSPVGEDVQPGPEAPAQPMPWNAVGLAGVAIAALLGAALVIHRRTALRGDRR